MWPGKILFFFVLVLLFVYLGQVRVALAEEGTRPGSLPRLVMLLFLFLLDSVQEFLHVVLVSEWVSQHVEVGGLPSLPHADAGRRIRRFVVQLA